MRDINDLRFFAAVVAHEGFSAASRALDVPKSRLSRRVALLEDQLGVRLIERSTRRISLTDVGREVYEHARAAMIEAEAVSEIALRMQAEPRGLVRLSCPLGMEPVLASLLPEILAAHPLLRIQCIVSNRRVDLIEEGIDIAVRVRERLDTNPMLQMRRVGVSRRILVASPVLAGTLPPLGSLQDLLSLPLLDHEEGRVGSWRLIGPAGQAETISVDSRFASGSFELLLANARFGLGIAFLPERNCRADLEAGTLVRIMPDWSGADGIIHIVFTSRRGMLPSVRTVIDAVVERLRTTIA